MVLPFITSISRDVFEAVPPVLKEAAYGLGCTTWEVVRYVVLPYTRVGVIGGVMLGLGRALGETMAVTFVIGNAHRISASLLAPGTTISATIANEFTEAVGDLYTSSLIALGLILFVITFIVLAIGSLHADAHRASDRVSHHESFSTPVAASATRVVMASRSAPPPSASAGWCWCSAPSLWERLRRPVAVGLHRDDAASRQRRRPPQPDHRQPDHDRRRGRDRHADRNPRRHLPGRVRQVRTALPGGALHQRHPAVGALDRRRPVHLRGDGGADGALLRHRRCGGARRHRRAGRRAHHRGHADPGAAKELREAARPRSACRAPTSSATCATAPPAPA